MGGRKYQRIQAVKKKNGPKFAKCMRCAETWNVSPHVDKCTYTCPQCDRGKVKRLKAIMNKRAG